MPTEQTATVTVIRKPVRNLVAGDLYVWEDALDRMHLFTVKSVEPTGQYAMGSDSNRIMRVTFTDAPKVIKHIETAEENEAIVASAR